MEQALDRILAGQDYSIVEEFALPPRAARFREIPAFLLDSCLGAGLQALAGQFGGLWHHQSLALERIGDGANVVVSTGTASGKSLIFRSAAFHRTATDPQARVLVFYPLKALASDQAVAWKAQARELGLPDGFVGRIDGTVPMAQREGILEQGRILLMTPDVCHAWLMSNLAKPAVKRLLRHLALFVLDEAHTLEGVFGSHFSYLFRRLLAARNCAIGGNGRGPAPAVIAATATIANPARHLADLTGLSFEVVGPQDDGSPQHARRVVHLAAPPRDEMGIARSLQVALMQQVASGGFITFVDSRKGVELLAVAANRELDQLLSGQAVMPYRAGLDNADRQDIERRLQEGTLRGVVSTSALELGIDLPHLRVGINLGVPSTRKAYRQRLGRVGRAAPGAFVVIAEPQAFRRFGTSFREYHDLSVEPSYLYLDNRFMQYAHAHCLCEEVESCGGTDRSTLPGRVQWPEGFASIYQAARPDGVRPREFDAIAQQGGDTPQRNYPLRNVGEINFKIGAGEHGDAMGEATLPQALRECYPGATYYHLARPYKVLSWRTFGYQPFIKVKPGGGPLTKPRIRTWINASLIPADLVERHLRLAPNGLVAECQMQITEKVVGFEEGDVYRSYDELRASNANMRPRMRQFRTTGVILRCDHPWFRDAANKRLVADSLRELFCREYSVLPQDVDASSTNIAVTTREGHQAVPDAVVVFDQTYGSLRLTERVFTELAHLLDRLAIGADSETGDERERRAAMVEHLRAFTATLEEAQTTPGDQDPLPTVDGGIIQVFAPGSLVGLREQGVLFTDVRIITAAMMPMPPDDAERLMYQVQCPPRYAGSPPSRRWIAADYLEATAEEGEWEYALWDTRLQRYVENGEGAGESASAP